MTIRKVIAITLATAAVFSVCDQASADPSPPQCAPSKGVYTWNLPIYWGQPDSPTFPYSFQIQLATGADPSTAPLGIVIPGGAGAPSIGTKAGTIFPDTFNVIYTDVRGVGCNKNAAFATAAPLTTEYFSRDVLSIVQVLGLRNYVLYGVSYGTVQATVMANIARNEGIQPPRALVLEGILGNWWIRGQNLADYNRVWTNAKGQLPAEVVSTLQTSSPYGISSADWALFLTHTLNEGTTPQLGNTTVYYLRPLGNPDTQAQALAVIQDLIAQYKQIPPETFWLATVSSCTEVEGNTYPMDLVNGEIVNTDQNLCAQFGLQFTHPYDSAQYPVNVPIYYFEGSADPTTTPQNAKYHFDNQTQADRVFTLVWGGGHTDMSRTLNQTGCTPAIFTAIATNPAGLGAALQQCHWPMTTSVRPAGQ